MAGKACTSRTGVRGRFTACLVAALTVLLAAAEAVPPRSRLLPRAPPLAPSAQDPSTAASTPTAEGMASITPRVVGGANAPVGRFKHQVGFYTEGNICGGTLIRPDVVLTAAHCIMDPPDISNLWVVVGAQRYFHSADFGGGTRYWVANIVTHPLYDDKYLHNDVALLFLQTPVALGPTVGTIDIASLDEFNAARFGTWMVSGYGSTSLGAGADGTGGKTATVLQYGLVKFQDPSNIDCRRMMLANEANMMLCAGGLPSNPGSFWPPNQDACDGDSGGPLVLNTGASANPVLGDPSGDRLVGVVSTGLGCGMRHTPGIYVNIINYKPWVDCTIAARGSSPSCNAQPLNRAWGYQPVSADKNWAGVPIFRALRVPPTRPIKAAAPGLGASDWCRTMCALLRPAACAAFSISVKPPPVPTLQPTAFCNMFVAPPARLCAAGDATGLCTQASAGSFQYAYA